MSGQKILDGLKQAVEGDFYRVTIDGQIWMKANDIASSMQEIMRINNAMRVLLNEALEFGVSSEWCERVRETITA